MPYMNDQCEQMLKISNEFVRLQVSNEEYLCMKVLLLLSTGELLQKTLMLDPYIYGQDVLNELNKPT